MRARFLLPILLLIGCGGSKPSPGPIQVGNYSAILSSTEVQYELEMTILGDNSITAEGNYRTGFPPGSPLPISATGTLTEEGILHLALTGESFSDEAHLNVTRTPDGFEGFDIFAGAPEVLFSIQADLIE